MEIIEIIAIIFIPVAYASIGELICERSGILNLGIEGNMILAAFIGWFFSTQYNSIFIGLIFVLIIGILTAFIFWLLIEFLELQQHIVGLGIGFFCNGLALTLFRLTPSSLKESQINLIINKDFLILFTGIILLVICIILFNKKSRFNNMLSLISDDIRSADLIGIDFKKQRLFAVLLGISLIFISGYLVSCLFMQSFTMGIISGKGWIALCIVILSRWNIRYILIASLFWAILEIGQFYIQSSEINIPYQLLLMLPYLGCFIVVAIGGSGKNIPKMLTKIYNRQEDAS